MARKVEHPYEPLSKVNLKDLRTCLRGLGKMFTPKMRWKVVISVLLGSVSIACSLSYVAISKRLVDIATGTIEGSIWKGVAVFVGIILVQLLTRIGSSYWNSYMTMKCANEMRMEKFSHVIGSKWTGKDSFHSGDTINRLEEDIRVVNDVLCGKVPDLIITIIQLFASSIYLLNMAPRLLWVVVLLAVVAVVGSRMYFGTLRRLTAIIRRRESEVQQHMQENLQSRVLVLTLIGAQRVADRLGWLQGEVESNTVRRLNYNAVARGFMNFGFLSGSAAAFLWGIFGIRAGTVTYGMMTAFLQLVSQVQRPIAEISRQIPAFIHSLTSIERLMDLDDLPEEEVGDPIMISGAPGIRIENLSFTYPDGYGPVLDNLCYDFAPGTMTVIMGPTGAGKSTLIRLVLGLLEPQKGSVTIYSEDGVSVKSGSLTRGNFMYVPQGNSLMSGTIRDNLLLADPEATEEKMKKALEISAASFVLDLPDGLDTVCGEDGGGLSEGQCQRIAIARALLQKGGVLILDESTSALDGVTEEALLQNLNREYHGKRTILFISHREAVSKFADGSLYV